MKKEEKIEALLGIHCKSCSGKIFDCRGCTKEEEITKIINSK